MHITERLLNICYFLEKLKNNQKKTKKKKKENILTN